MEYFIAFSQSSKNRNSIFYRGLIYHNRLETTFQGCILFNILTILIQSSCTDTMKLATCKHWLKHVAGIHGTICFTCAHNKMKLINKQDNLTFAFLNFFQHSLQTFLKFASIFSSGYQSSHIQSKNFLVLQCFRHISCHDSLGKTFYGCSFTNARLTNENRVVLGLTGKDSDHITDLAVSSDNRIKLLASGFLYQVFTIFIQSIIGCLRIVAYHTLISTNCGKCL